MHSTNAPNLRRSSRVPITVPLMVTSLEPGAQFSEVCETLVVSAHGCAMRSPAKLESGVPLRFHSQDGREATAQVVYCQPIESDQSDSDQAGWKLGAVLDRPENFWGLKTYPRDWVRLLPPSANKHDKLDKRAPALPPENVQVMSPDAATVKTVLERIKNQLSDEHLKGVLAELVQPFAGEVNELKEKVARSAQRNRFEVSLSQIPPEVTEQLEIRLRRELEPHMLQQVREQSEQVLEAAKAAITQKTTESHTEFRQLVTQDLQTVEQRAQELSTAVMENLQEHLNRGLGELHQELVDAGDRLRRLSANLSRVLQSSSDEQHVVRCQELEQVRATVVAESARLQEQIGELDQRMTKLDECARELESGLDQRLSRLASDTVRTTRAALDSALQEVLNELGVRNAQALANQLDQASANLKVIQRGIETAVSGSLKIQVAETLESFEQSMEELAQQTVERWRLTLAGSLNSLVGILSDQLRLQASEAGNGNHARSK